MRKTFFINTIVIALLAVFTSCEYEYDMPDMSDVEFEYRVDELPAGLKAELVSKIEATGRPMEALTAKFTPVITEKDAAGNIVYQGEARNVVNKNAKTIELAYRCEARLPSSIDMAFSSGYYGMGLFKFSKSFPVELSPRGMNIGVQMGDEYTADLETGCSVYSVKNSFYDVIDKDFDAIGYDWTDISYTIEERNADGKVIDTLTPSSLSYCFASADSAKSVTISMTVTGRPASSYTQTMPVYTYTFTKKFALDVFSITEIELTPDLECTRKDPDTSSMSSIYTVESDMGAQITTDIEGTGYEMYGVEYEIVEKDKGGNVLRTRSDISTPYGSVVSEAGAASVEITIKAYGSAPGKYSKTLIYEYKFTPVKLDPLKPVDIVLSEVLGYNRVTADLSQISRVYSVTNKFTTVISDVEAAGYEYYGVEYTFTEKDERGNVLKSYTDISTPYGQVASEPGAASVEITVKAYGLPEGSYSRVLVYTYKFAPFRLTPLQPTPIVLSENVGYTRENG